MGTLMDNTDLVCSRFGTYLDLELRYVSALYCDLEELLCDEITRRSTPGGFPVC